MLNFVSQNHSAYLQDYQVSHFFWAFPQVKSEQKHSLVGRALYHSFDRLGCDAITRNPRQAPTGDWHWLYTRYLGNGWKFLDAMLHITWYKQFRCIQNGNENWSENNMNLRQFLLTVLKMEFQPGMETVRELSSKVKNGSENLGKILY